MPLIELCLLAKAMMRELIASDENLLVLYDQLTLVKGVGFVVAVSMIIVSDEFKTITGPRKMACHCGVTLFRKVSKVSHWAHKPMKTLLNMAVLNAIRNKLIHRIYAVARDNRKHKNSNIHALA